MRLLGARAVAERLSISKSKLYDMLKRQQFPAAPIRLPGGSPRWPEKMVDAWIERHRVGGPVSAG